MRKSVSRLTVAAFATVLLFAAVASPALAAAPPGWHTVDVTLQTGDQGQKEIVVYGQLPADAKLPFQGELAVPAGTELRWIGEILGGPVADDPSLQFTKSTAQGMDVYRFTMSKARIAQFEGDIQAVTTSNGGVSTTALTWTAWRNLPEVYLRERLPQGAQVMRAADGATIEAATTGGDYYTRTFKDVKAGQKLDLTFSYTVPAALLATGTSAAAGSNNTVALVVTLTLAAIAFAGLIFAAWRSMPRSAESASAKTPAASGKAAVVTAKAPAAGSKMPAEPVKGSARATEPEIAVRKRVSPAIVATVVCGVLAVAVAGAVSLATATPVVNGKLTKFFGATSPCDSVSIPIVANEGVDLARQGAAIVDAFTGAEGVGDVTLDVAQSRLDVAFCESSQSEDTVRQIVSGTGLVTMGASAAASPESSEPVAATLAASGKKQTASVDTAGGTFGPAAIALKAGVPAEITFGKAAGCITEVVFAELDIRQSLEGRPVKVRIPALEPGTYGFACGMDMERGTLVVE